MKLLTLFSKKKVLLRRMIALELGLSILLVGCGVDKSKETTEEKCHDYLSWDDYQIEIEGAVNTEDNPWGYTAGIVDCELGDCILLTPNTSFTVVNITSDTVISLQAEIYPAVADSSDGAGVIIWFMNDSDDIIEEQSLDISSDDSWVDIQYSLDHIDGVSKIKFLCNNGKGDDDSADWIMFRGNNTFLSDFGNDGYVKSVTYFGNEWPINFWNSELETLDEDFKQIKADGFDSIILVIPWKEFQPCVSPIEYSTYTFENLDKVMIKAEEYNLNVYTRIGYNWDYYNDSYEDIAERYIDIMKYEETHEAWLAYCSTLYETLSRYSNFKDGFLTWEDFWICLKMCDYQNLEVRVKYASEVGYQDWVKTNFSIKEFNNKYGLACSDYNEIPIPTRTEPAMEAFYKFFDEYLNSILLETQAVFPNISNEVRMDADLVTNTNGESSYYSHTSTYECENSDYTATMYGIPMGFENVGERVSAEEALQHTEYILSNLINQNDGKPVYVEQFLFMDNTPNFSYNAQIKDDEVGKYLESVADVLFEYTRGYGIWTYRDYRTNMLYNSQFALEGCGWDTIGTPEFAEVDDSKVCVMNEGDVISQTIPSVRNHFPEEQYIFVFDVSECEEATIEIWFGNNIETLTISEVGQYKFVFDKNDAFDFKMKILDGDIAVDNLCLYSFVQEGHLYNENNEKMEYIDSIRILNETLENME